MVGTLSGQAAASAKGYGHMHAKKFYKNFTSHKSSKGNF